MEAVIILGAVGLLLAVAAAVAAILGAVFDWPGMHLFAIGAWCWALAVLCGLCALTWLAFTAIAWAVRL